MKADEWQQINDLFHAALEREPGARAAFLALDCAGDEGLRLEVESLLASHDPSDSFIASLAPDLAAGLLAESHARLATGQLVGNYRVMALLGAGGMGEVYLTEDTRLGRRVALKLLPAQFTREPDRLRRFEREARAASSLNHPNIITIHEVGQVEGQPFIITEFIEGKTLRQQMAAAKMRLREALDVAIQVASALEAAHKAGIVHRDIKPENIMLRPDGLVKVLDFGLAKLTEKQSNESDLETPTLLQSTPGLLMGTVQYMSPEQARGSRVDGRTDIWSLGVVLYELLTGRVPFAGETPSHVMVSIMEHAPPPLGEPATVPAELDRIVTKSLRKIKKERYQTARELARDLKNLKRELQVEGRLKQSLALDEDTRLPQSVYERELNGTTPALAARTVSLGVAHPTSSAEYFVSEMKRHRGGLAITAVAVLALATVAYFYFNRNRSPIPSGEAIDSIAVLPFVNVNNDPNTEYLAEGISDNIINSLSSLPKVRVNSLNSVLRYKGKRVEAQVAGRELNVRTVLTGRMTQEGDDLSITVELVDVKDNSRLWGGQYNRKLSEIITVQTEIAQQISANLRLRLSGDEKKQLARNYTQNTWAYQLYILGKYFMRESTPEALQKAIDRFEEASKIDPNYTLAYTGLYSAYHRLGQAGHWLPTEARVRMEWAALKAVELDDTSTEAHIQLATIKKINWDWAGSEKEYKRALELDPNEWRPHFSYAAFLLDVGRPDEAMPYAQRVEELDREQRGPAAVAMVYLYKGQYDKAHYDKAIELYLKRNAEAPSLRNPPELWLAYVANGMPQEALNLLDKGVPADQSPVTWNGFPMRAYIYAMAGRRAEALQILRQQQRAAKQQYISPFNFAIIYTGLGEKDLAFEYLKKACEEHVVVLSHYAYGPMFESLHSDPRYKVLLRSMNLPA